MVHGLVSHKILIMMNETILYVDLSPPNTSMQATLNHLFFLVQMNELSHYQTIPLQYRLIFHSPLLYIFYLKIFEDCLKTNSLNLLFHKFLQYFQILHHQLKFPYSFYLQKWEVGHPKLFVLIHTNQVSFLSLILISLYPCLDKNLFHQ